MKTRLLGVVSAWVAFFSLCTSVNAAFFGRLETSPGSGVFQAYYDDQLGITWAANANINGNANWFDQLDWAANVTIGGIGGWRLPSMDVNGDFAVADCSLEATQAACADNEYGHLLYYGSGTAKLTGDVSNFSSGVTPDSPGPFSNLQNVTYWSGTRFQPGSTSSAWAFTFGGAFGTQASLTSDVGSARAWAVHDGDVGTLPIPLPVDIEKLTNGMQADAANDADVPRIASGSMVTWTYQVTNNGEVAFSEAEVVVTDSQPGVSPVLDVTSDDGDLLLSPGETWSYTATGQALARISHRWN